MSALLAGSAASSSIARQHVFYLARNLGSKNQTLLKGDLRVKQWCSLCKF